MRFRTNVPWLRAVTRARLAERVPYRPRPPLRPKLRLAARVAAKRVGTEERGAPRRGCFAQRCRWSGHAGWLPVSSFEQNGQWAIGPSSAKPARCTERKPSKGLVAEAYRSGLGRRNASDHDVRRTGQPGSPPMPTTAAMLPADRSLIAGARNRGRENGHANGRPICRPRR